MFQKKKSKALLSAVSKGQINKVKSLLDGGADPEFADPEGRSPLMLAAGEGHAGIAQDLIRAGARVNQRSKSRETALMFAARKGSAPLMEILLKAGAKVNARNRDNITALMFSVVWATRMASVGITGTEHKVALLLGAGAKVNRADLRSRSPLMAAIRSGGGSLEEANRLPLLRMLLDHKVEVNAQSDKGRTALMYAAFRGLSDSFKLLVQAGADYDLRDAAGQNALMYAARGCFWSYRQAGYITVVNLLLDKEVDLAARDNRGHTALKIAELYGPAAIASLLEKAGAGR